MKLGCLGTIIVLALIYVVLTHFGLWAMFWGAIMSILAFIGIIGGIIIGVIIIGIILLFWLT